MVFSWYEFQLIWVKQITYEVSKKNKKEFYESYMFTFILIIMEFLGWP